MGLGEGGILQDHRVEGRDRAIEIAGLELCHRCAEDFLEILGGSARAPLGREEFGVRKHRGFTQGDAHGRGEDLKAFLRVGELPVAGAEADLHELALLVGLGIEGEVHPALELHLDRDRLDRLSLFVEDLAPDAAGLGRRHRR